MAFGQQASMRLPTAVKRYYEGDIWSTQSYANAAALANVVSDLFSVRRGATGQGFAAGLSIAETNVLEAGRIASGLAFTVRQIAIEPRYDDMFAVVGADLRNLQTNCVPVWAFLNTNVEIAPVALIGQGGGIFGSTADTGAVEGGLGGSRIALNNGAGQTWIYHELPVLLPANTTFSLQLQWGSRAVVVDGGTNNSDLLVRAHLLGIATSAIPEG